MTDIIPDQQNLVPIRELPSRLPGKPRLSTVYTWLHGDNVDGIRLESIVIGGKRYVSPEAVRRFIAARSALLPVARRPSKKRKQLVH